MKNGDTFHEVIIMVKGISKQVIVVHSPEEKLFEQAIFILNEKITNLYSLIFTIKLYFQYLFTKMCLLL